MISKSNRLRRGSGAAIVADYGPITVGWMGGLPLTIPWQAIRQALPVLGLRYYVYAYLRSTRMMALAQVPVVLVVTLYRIMLIST